MFVVLYSLRSCTVTGHNTGIESYYRLCENLSILPQTSNFAPNSGILPPPNQNVLKCIARLGKMQGPSTCCRLTQVVG